MAHHFHSKMLMIPSGNSDRIGDVEGEVLDSHASGFPQPQPCLPQLEFFLGRARRTRKMVSVATTIPVTVSVCQSIMLEAEESAGLKNDQ